MTNEDRFADSNKFTVLIEAARINGIFAHLGITPDNYAVRVFPSGTESAYLFSGPSYGVEDMGPRRKTLNFVPFAVLDYRNGSTPPKVYVGLTTDESNLRGIGKKVGEIACSAKPFDEAGLSIFAADENTPLEERLKEMANSIVGTNVANMAASNQRIGE